jgi:hypothetical protein
MPLEGQSHKCNLAWKCKAWKPADSMIISSIRAKEYGWVEEPTIPTQPLLVLNWAPNTTRFAQTCWSLKQSNIEQGTET